VVPQALETLSVICWEVICPGPPSGRPRTCIISWMAITPAIPPVLSTFPQFSPVDPTLGLWGFVSITDNVRQDVVLRTPN
jgi:hypothetical protein